ncbi:peptidase M16 [Elstera litoralis]|uniref:Peptidase M16 n=1 Tax=Elstera litoralis TaxID=552518 RepID=A0A0F3IW20_9PROT|nr:pitrilysin family protein [Elstera litoralis]KJV10950.1 peptidase M16 [Elstera litoralis]
MVTLSTLRNGLTVLTDYMPGAETVSLGVWVGVGTRDEAAEQNGIAHVLEHMAFKGTLSLSAREIAEKIEDVGGHLNAYTTREHTAYYAKVLAADTPLAVSLLADILLNSVFDGEELTRERAVILQEIGQAMDTPDDVIFDQFQEIAYPDQPLGRPVLGRAEIVESITREQLSAYLKRHYHPKNMIVAAAGKIDHAAFEALVSAAFGDMTGSALETLPAQARYIGGTQIEARDLEQSHLVIGFPTVSANDPDYYALSVYSTILGGGMSSRLFQEVREKRGLVYSVYSFASTYRDTGVMGIYAGTGPDELAKLIPVIADEIQRLPDTLTAPEIARAHAQLRAGTLMARESTSARVEALAQNFLTYGRTVEVAEVLERLAAVSTDDIRRLGGRFITATPTLALLGPEATLDPMALFAARLSRAAA